MKTGRRNYIIDHVLKSQKTILDQTTKGILIVKLYETYLS